MGLDEPLSHYQIRLGHQCIDHQLCPRRQHSQLRQRRCIAVVDNNVLLFHDFPAQLLLQLRSRSAPVTARCHQESNLDGRITLPEFFEHMGNNVPAGHRTGVIADNNHRRPLILSQLPQRGASNRISHSMENGLVLIGTGRQALDL